MLLCYRIRVWAFVVGSALFALPVCVFAQSASTPGAIAFGRIPQQLAEPAVPADPLELVAGDAQPVRDVTQRAETISLLMNAHRHGNVRTYAYDLKTRFTAFGSSGSDGSWQLEDVSPGTGVYRWTAQGPSYSAVNFYHNWVLYSNQPANSVPMRLVQARAAIFFTQTMLGPQASLRTAAANFNSSELVCALVSHAPMVKGATGGRRWEEAEYCVDAKSSNLVTYSPVPGFYVLYDYANAVHFHDIVVANKFTITQAGRTILEAQVDSVSDVSGDGGCSWNAVTE